MEESYELRLFGVGQFEGRLLRREWGTIDGSRMLVNIWDLWGTGDASGLSLGEFLDVLDMGDEILNVWYCRVLPILSI